MNSSDNNILGNSNLHLSPLPHADGRRLVDPCAAVAFNPLTFCKHTQNAPSAGGVQANSGLLAHVKRIWRSCVVVPDSIALAQFPYMQPEGVRTSLSALVT